MKKLFVVAFTGVAVTQAQAIDWATMRDELAAKPPQRPVNEGKVSHQIPEEQEGFHPGHSEVAVSKVNAHGEFTQPSESAADRLRANLRQNHQVPEKQEGFHPGASEVAVSKVNAQGQISQPSGSAADRLRANLGQSHQIPEKQEGFHPSLGKFGWNIGKKPADTATSHENAEAKPEHSKTSALDFLKSKLPHWGSNKSSEQQKDKNNLEALLARGRQHMAERDEKSKQEELERERAPIDVQKEIAFLEKEQKLKEEEEGLNSRLKELGDLLKQMENRENKEEKREKAESKREDGENKKEEAAFAAEEVKERRAEERQEEKIEESH